MSDDLHELSDESSELPGTHNEDPSRPRAAARDTVGFLRRLLPRVRPYRRAFFWVGVLLPISTAIGLAFPLIVMSLLDAGDRGLLNIIALGLLGLFTIQSIINFGQSYLTASVSERVVADLRKDLFGHLVHQSPGFYASRRVGELTSRLASDIGLLQGVIRFGVPELLRQALFLVGALVIVTWTNPRLTLVTLVAVPFAILVGWFFGRRVRTLSKGIQDSLAGAMSRAEQVFTQIRTVQVFTREPWEIDRFRAEVDRTRDLGLKRAVARAALTGAITFAASAAIVMVIWEGGRLVDEGEITWGALVAFLLYVVTIAGAVTSLAGFWANLQEAAGAADRVFAILDHTPEIQSPDSPTPLPHPVRGEVTYEDVWFRYGSDQPWVLRDLSFSVEPGETVALVGSSGVGKSTTVGLLTRFYDVERGRVAVDGIDVRDLDLTKLRSVVGMVPQEPMLFAGTVRDNLRYGSPDATDAEIEEAGRAAHAHEFIQGFPDGYATDVGERGVTLSAGQRQRMAIARVMLERPRVLILDEASASLDSESEALVQDALDRLVRDRTTLVIAHRLSTVLSADRILVLSDGVIVDQGVHLELLERSDVYARLYKRQFDQVAGRV